MALKKSIIDFRGIEASYYKIVRADFVGSKAYIFADVYHTQEARDAEKDPMEHKFYEVEMPQASGTLLEILYNALKNHPDFEGCENV